MFIPDMAVVLAEHARLTQIEKTKKERSLKRQQDPLVKKKVKEHSKERLGKLSEEELLKFRRRKKDQTYKSKFPL
jgi:hypothetical protein